MLISNTKLLTFYKNLENVTFRCFEISFFIKEYILCSHRKAQSQWFSFMLIKNLNDERKMDKES